MTKPHRTAREKYIRSRGKNLTSLDVVRAELPSLLKDKLKEPNSLEEWGLETEKDITPLYIAHLIMDVKLRQDKQLKEDAVPSEKNKTAPPVAKDPVPEVNPNTSKKPRKPLTEEQKLNKAAKDKERRQTRQQPAEVAVGENKPKTPKLTAEQQAEREAKKEAKRIH